MLAAQELDQVLELRRDASRHFVQRRRRALDVPLQHHGAERNVAQSGPRIAFQADDDVELGELGGESRYPLRLGAGEVEAVRLDELEQLGSQSIGGRPARAHEDTALGVVLARPCLAELTGAIVALIDEQDSEGLRRFGLAGGGEDGLLADVLGLVGDALEAVQDDEQSVQLGQRAALDLAFVQQVGEQLAHHRPLRLGEPERAAREVGAAFAKRLERAMQEVAPVRRHQLEVAEQRLRWRTRELQRLTTDGGGVVADALELEIDAQHRRNEPQMARRGQVSRDKGVAARVDVADQPVDPVVAEDRAGGEHAVAVHDHPLGAAQRLLDVGADREDALLEVGEVALQAFLVVTHPGQLIGRTVA